MAWLFLAAAIVTEVVGTVGLRWVADESTWWRIALIVLAYGVSFLFMTLALRQLNVAVVYAIWSAIGIAAISVAGALFFDERLSVQAVIGIVVVLVGVIVLVTSGSTHHSGVRAVDVTSSARR